jgi:hypothetical protein
MENKIFNITSNTANNKSKFVYELPSTYHNIAYLRIRSIEIPHTIYTFSTSKDNLTFIITYASIDYTVTIAEGNYTPETLITEIQTKLDIINTTTSQKFEITLNTINNKISIYNDKGNSFDLNFTRSTSLVNTYPNIGYYLGFTEELYSNITTITGINQINLIDTNYVYLRINDIENIRDEIVHYAFCKIMLKNDEKNTYYIREEDIIGSIHYFRGPKNIKRLNIELVDYKGIELTITPFNVSITLEAGFIYDSELFKKLNHYRFPSNFGIDNRMSYLIPF